MHKTRADLLSDVSIRRLAVACLALGVGLTLAAEAPLPQAQSTPLGAGKIEFVEIDKAAPVVVFENGLGGKIQAWDKVAPVIAGTNSVFAYNRPGVGASSPTRSPPRRGGRG